jgi:hypothetical protein
MDGVADRDEVGSSSNVFEILNACVFAFEFTIKLCIIGELSEAM